MRWKQWGRFFQTPARSGIPSIFMSMTSRRVAINGELVGRRRANHEHPSRSRRHGLCPPCVSRLSRLPHLQTRYDCHILFHEDITE